MNDDKKPIKFRAIYKDPETIDRELVALVAAKNRGEPVSDQEIAELQQQWEASSDERIRDMLTPYFRLDARLEEANQMAQRAGVDVADLSAVAETCFDQNGMELPGMSDKFEKMITSIEWAATHAGNIVVGREQKQNQSKKAQLPRNPEKKEIEKMVEELARHRDWKARELWPELFTMMEAAYMDPEDTGNKKQPKTWARTYATDKKGQRKTLKFSTFQNMLTEAREKLSL